MLNDGLARMRQINKDVNNNNQLMDHTNQQLVEDNERLMEIGERIKTTVGVLKEAGKHITAVAKSYYKDKCIVGVSILVLLLVITVVVVGIVKNKSASATAASPTPSTANATNATNATNSTAFVFSPVILDFANGLSQFVPIT